MTSGSLITKETLVTDKELDRNAARRLAIIKHAQKVTGERRDDLPLLRDEPPGLLHLGCAATRPNTQATLTMKLAILTMSALAASRNSGHGNSDAARTRYEGAR